VDGCEILHQLIGGKHPIIYRLSTIFLVVQDFATIHSHDIILEGISNYLTPTSVDPHMNDTYFDSMLGQT
jgi:hypothetical protein